MAVVVFLLRQQGKISVLSHVILLIRSYQIHPRFPQEEIPKQSQFHLRSNAIGALMVQLNDVMTNFPLC